MELGGEEVERVESVAVEVGGGEESVAVAVVGRVERSEGPLLPCGAQEEEVRA